MHTSSGQLEVLNELVLSATDQVQLPHASRLKSHTVSKVCSRAGDMAKATPGQADSAARAEAGGEGEEPHHPPDHWV